MKNKIKILFLSIFMLFAMNLNVYSSDPCPTSSHMITKPIFINGCVYDVVICYSCPPTGPQNTLQIWSFSKQNIHCTQTFSTDQVLGAIWDIIMSQSFLEELFEYCWDQDPIPPCDVPFTQDHYIQRIEYICWEKWNEAGRIYYYPCYDASVFCQTIWKVCIRDGTIEFHPYYGPVVNGDIEEICPSDNEPADPGINQQTNCFSLKSLCWPY